ncbi:MdlB ABC-type multidrug transport system, ATPase and permease components [Methylophilaceae bacterium]
MIQLFNFWSHISSIRKKEFALVVLLIIFTSFAEILSIGAALPFLKILTNPEFIFQNKELHSIIQFIGITDQSKFITLAISLFATMTIVAGFLRLNLSKKMTRLAFRMGSDFSEIIYRRALYQPYPVHCERNSSEIIDGIVSKSRSLVFYFIFPYLTIIASILTIAMVFIALLFYKPTIVLLVFAGFFLFYSLFFYSYRKQLSINSQNISKASTIVQKSLQEGFNSIRDIIINNDQEAYTKIYSVNETLLAKSQADNLVIASTPRYFVEIISLLIILGIVYMMFQRSVETSKIVTFVGILVITAQRLLPMFQQIYGAWTNIQGGKSSVQDVLNLINQPLPNYKKFSIVKTISFKKNIVCNKISFRYNKVGPLILKDITFKIEKGSRIGFVGPTGCGKSTLLDLIMGLLSPTEGNLEVDGKIITPKNQRAWQAHIAHVPQSIYLSDTTVEQNIAFGVPLENVDHKRVLEAARLAQISLTIESWPIKYKTLIGENGVRLSGGQRQRIGIARALYKKADVIILDEATSALDSATEKKVMQAINNASKNITILIIAHRIISLKNCTHIVKLKQGKILCTKKS